jgi:glucose 1-dehydrogenase
LPTPPLYADLAGRVALVTGASSGIGRATAVELARQGARIAVNYPEPASREGAGETARLMREAAPDADPLLVQADVSVEADVEQMVERVCGHFGALDVLVNNAGIQVVAATHEADVDDFDRVMAVNTRGPFLTSRAAIRGWIAEGRGGVIVNVSSVHEKIPRPSFASYAMSKFALRGLTQTLALEYARQGIRVNSIAPGATETPIQSWLGDEEQTAVVRANIPQERIASPQEIAQSIAFLASGTAPYMTGQTLFVDGGLTLYPAFQDPWSG